MSSQRYIAHFDLDSFFVSVERIKDISLVGKPVVVGGHSDRAVVAACSYETRKYGVHSAMPMKQALRLCPEAIVVKGSMADYSRYSRMVTDIINQKMPLVEKASIDEFYADLTGMDKFFGCYQYTKELKQQIIAETGLPVSFALASNKLISKIATNEAKPNGEIEILSGTEKTYLAPMVIEKMPMVGERTKHSLQNIGIYTIGQMADTPIALLQKLLGKTGVSLWQKANGIDSGVVTPDHEQKSISSENTFEKDTIDQAFLLHETVRLVEKICYELRADKKFAGCLTIKIRYENFETVSKQTVIDFTSSDHIVIPQAKSLFQQLCTIGRPVRLIGVRFSRLINENYQLNLFRKDDATPSLYHAIDAVKQKFGAKMVQRAVSLQALSNPELRPDSPLWFDRNAKSGAGDDNN
ncbi:MAG: DNA polymerase IV [Chitinophagaceae bacterium]